LNLLGGAAIGVVAALGLAATADAKPTKHHHKAPVMKAEVHDLNAEIEALRARLDADEASRMQDQAQVQAAQAEAAAARADANALRAQVAQQIQTIPGTVNQAIAAAAPGDKIPYKGVKITLGGFAAAEGVYRSKSDLADISSNYAKIPLDNNVLNHTSELRGTARQSRLSLLAQGDISPDTTAGFYGEFDFLAGPQTANSNESNSFSPRIRNLYGQIDWNGEGVHLLAGQNWSLATLNSHGITPRNEVPPPTIEAQYVPGFTWARQPQIRLTKNFGDDIWLAASLENPATIYSSAATGVSATATGITAETGATAISGFDSANTITFNHVPDVIAKVAFEPTLGGAHPIHLEAYGLYRGFTDRIVAASGNLPGVTPGFSNYTTNGGGFGAGATWTVVPKLLDVQASGLWGKGIGRYGASGLPDATLTPTGAVQPIKESMVLVGGTLHALPTLDAYVFWGEEVETSEAFNPSYGGHYGLGNSYANMTNCFVENGSCTANLKQVDQITAGLWDKAYTGKFGQIRIGLQYSHTNLTAFSANAGAGPFLQPKTSDDMVFTSFRYYPF
jgi:hypothetical protein